MKILNIVKTLNFNTEIFDKKLGNTEINVGGFLSYVYLISQLFVDL